MMRAESVAGDYVQTAGRGNACRFWLVLCLDSGTALELSRQVCGCRSCCELYGKICRRSG